MSPGVGFIPIISTKGINQIRKGNCKKKEYVLYIQKVYYIFKNMGAILCGCNTNQKYYIPTLKLKLSAWGASVLIKGKFKKNS